MRLPGREPSRDRGTRDGSPDGAWTLEAKGCPKRPGSNREHAAACVPASNFTVRPPELSAPDRLGTAAGRCDAGATTGAKMLRPGRSGLG